MPFSFHCLWMFSGVLVLTWNINGRFAWIQSNISALFPHPRPPTQSIETWLVLIVLQNEILCSCIFLFLFFFALYWALHIINRARPPCLVPGVCAKLWRMNSNNFYHYYASYFVFECFTLQDTKRQLAAFQELIPYLKSYMVCGFESSLCGSNVTVPFCQQKKKELITGLSDVSSTSAYPSKSYMYNI